MANSDAGTSSSNASGAKYQVFLNFCGEDTRRGITSFLHRDLVNNGIHAFIDNEELRVGEEIGRALLEAIDDSQIYIPIFSKNYASSKWCLRELARLVDNTSKSEEKKILPIFYDVVPDDVDLKNPVYRMAIEKHKDEHKKKQQERFPHEVEPWEGESWEGVLKKVDKIKGWELSECKDQADLVNKVVEAVLQELKIREKFVTEDLVGLAERVANVMKWLDVNYSEVRLLGIHGMGGIGKTTLARVVYNKLNSCFGKCCTFLDDIRETSKKEGLFSLQKKLLTEIASFSAAGSINDVHSGRKRIGEILRNKKALIVLDDVDEKEHIKNLIGQDQWCLGTRIIITTRNKGVLNSDNAIRILPYEMEGMNTDHALQLFKRHAFRGRSLAKDFDSLSIDIVNTTGGLPLALEIIGSLLFEKSKVKWEDTLNQLKKMPNECVQGKLMISYEALNYRQREIFLDVACLFINEDMTNAKYMWEACEFYPNSEIDVLVEMSLIKIKDENRIWMHENRFWMHDQLRDLGREIVRLGNPKNLKKWSRVWTSKDFFDFVRTEERYEDVEALDLRDEGFEALDLWRMSPNISISQDEIRRFKNLRFLRCHGETLHGDFIVSLPKLRWISWNSHSNLRWISWNSRSSNLSVPSVHAKNCVVLELSFCRLEDSKIGDLIKTATKLKSLAFVECIGLTRTPDLSGCLDLERLTFDRCKELKKIDRSLGKLTCLLDLNIIACHYVKRVPDEIGRLVKLESFSLRNCSKVSGLPTSVGDLASLRELKLGWTNITSLPDSIGDLASLRELDLGGTRITSLPDSIGKLRWLSKLYLYSLGITEIPDKIGELVELRCLGMTHTMFKQLPDSIGMLEKLEELHLRGCKNLEGEIPDEIKHLSFLRVLNLCETRICRLPGTINMLSRLSTLDLTRCDEIKELPELPASLVKLRVQSNSLQVVPNLSKLINLEDLLLSDGSDEDDEGLSNLKHKCDLGWIGRLSKLKKLKLCLLNIAAPRTELGPLSLLKSLALCSLDLQPLERLPPSLLCLMLKNVSSTGSLLSNLEIPSILKLFLLRLREIQLHGLSQLRDLHLWRCDLQSLSIPSGLRSLRIQSCKNMVEIQFLGMSASLEELSIEKCESFERMVLCGEGGSLGVLDQSESSSSESTDRSPGVLLPNALKKLKRLYLFGCQNRLKIQVISTLSSLEVIYIGCCDAIEKFSGVSNLKNLQSLDIYDCPKLRVVEGLNKLESLTYLSVCNCPSLETLLSISNSKIPDECKIQVVGCGKILHYSLERCTFKECKERFKMEGDAIEPDTELQPPCFSSTSSSDHEISEEPPFDNVREGTPPEKQNQMMGEDSSCLDELAPPRTFCDRFKTCLASLLERVCNCDFPNIKAEIL